jgi:hypothetical protein
MSVILDEAFREYYRMEVHDEESRLFFAVALVAVSSYFSQAAAEEARMPPKDRRRPRLAKEESIADLLPRQECPRNVVRIRFDT